MTRPRDANPILRAEQGPVGPALKKFPRSVHYLTVTVIEGNGEMATAVPVRQAALLGPVKNDFLFPPLEVDGKDHGASGLEVRFPQ